MTGLLFTAAFFPLVGTALSRLVRGAPVLLGGLGTAGLVIFVAGVWHVPPAWTLIALAVASIAILATFRREESISRAPLLPSALAALAAAILLFVSAVVPIHDYDGRAFWLMKAKAIAHEGAIDGPFFHGQTAPNRRNEYPLLVPANAAAVLTAAGDLDERHLGWVFAFYAIGLAMAMYRHLARQFGAAAGAWSAAILLWLPQILVDGEGGALSGYADIALGGFVACAFFELVKRESPLRLGMWCAFIVLTKNEGLPLALLLLGVGAAVFRRRIWQAVLPFAFAAAHLLIWRARVERREEEDLARAVLDLPQHFDRYLDCVRAMAAAVMSMRDWGAFLIVAAVAAFMARRAVVFAVVVPMVALYAAVYAVFEPSLWPIDTLSDNVAPRLWTHLLGPLFFAWFSWRRSRSTAAGSSP